jgi:D-Tyr-tRNAtyr deacylase
MNRSVQDVEGGLLVVSQFTLAADTSGGNRPSFTNAADPQTGQALYEHFVARARPPTAGGDRTLRRRHEGATHQRRPGHSAAAHRPARNQQHPGFAVGAPRGAKSRSIDFGCIGSPIAEFAACAAPA